MKKIITLLLSLSLLTACGGNHYSSVSDKDEVLFKTNDGTSYTKVNYLRLVRCIVFNVAIEVIVDFIFT